MITIVKLHKGQPLSQEQINEIEEAKKKTIVYDDDSPELTPTMKKAFIVAVKSRNRFKKEIS